ncbi:methyltransferase [Rhodobacteraceae bacterium]|nr:methyltransferase [Paracoccaceae bacterium]
MIETRDDAFLGGRLHMRQPVKGYRAGADPVFLAASVPAMAGQSVLELGCGVGTAMLCLIARVPDLSVTGIERDPSYAALARENCVNLGLGGKVVEADIVDLPASIRDQSFDHVLFNPPFFDRANSSAAPDDAREAGRGLDVTLETWVDIALRRTVSAGQITLIHRIEHLPDVLNSLKDRAGDIHVLPLQPRADKAAKLFVLKAKKGSKASFRLCSSLVLHKGDRHLADGDSYTDAATAILRGGAPISWSS